MSVLEVINMARLSIGDGKYTRKNLCPLFPLSVPLEVMIANVCNLYPED